MSPPRRGQKRVVLEGYGVPTVNDEELHSVPDHIYGFENEQKHVASGEPRSLLRGRTIGMAKLLPAAPIDAGEAEVFPLIDLRGPEDESCLVTVTLVPPPADLPGINNFTPHGSARAVVQWGCGGAYSAMECDFGNGAVFQLAASSLRISAYRTFSSFGDTPQELWGAFCSYNPNFRREPLTNTQKASAGANALVGATATYRVPPYAKRIYPIMQMPAPIVPPTPKPGMQIDFLNLAGVSIDSVIFGAGSPIITDGYIVPTDATLVAMTNLGPDVLATTARVVYELAI